MNNFSPSTDTSVGTKRFTAQEVQLAYTLMAVEYMKTVKIGRNELFVACPPGQLNNPEVTITKKAVDPIVYQPCAYGVLIHSMWGEESEDKVFEEYKRINNLML